MAQKMSRIIIELTSDRSLLLYFAIEVWRSGFRDFQRDTHTISLQFRRQCKHIFRCARVRVVFMSLLSLEIHHFFSTAVLARTRCEHRIF